MKKYFRRQGLRNWIFFAKIKDKEGNFQYLDLFYASKVKIKRHIKIRAHAHPYDPQFIEYLNQRDSRTKDRRKNERTLVTGSCKGPQKGLSRVR
jgi:RNA-directed DNA polymerase